MKNRKLSDKEKKANEAFNYFNSKINPVFRITVSKETHDLLKHRTNWVTLK